MSDEAFAELLALFKALAHESRLKILGLLADAEYSVMSLAELLELREPTVSHHLAKLHSLGLVTMRREGTTHYYRLDSKTLLALNQKLLTPERVQSFADGVSTEAWEQKVLRTYFDGDRLTQIPTSWKKRQVILRCLVERFDFDRDYAQSEVNAILKEHHPDCATLRREFLSCNLMTRTREVFRRLPQET